MKEILRLKGVEVEAAIRELREFYLPIALRTWNPESFRSEEAAMRYLELGLISELGELAAYEKRMLRGDSRGASRDDLVKELGDLIWYAMIGMVFSGESFDSFSGAIEVEEGRAFEQALLFTRHAFLWADRLCVVLALCGHYQIAIAEVAVRNAIKLNDRLERNVIKGVGDDR